MRMDWEMSSKGCSEVKQVAVSTLQEKNILQNSKVLSTKSHERTDASSENNYSFYTIADFSVRFTTLSVRNVSLQAKKANVSSRHIRVKWFLFKILMMCESIFFSRRQSPCSFSRCWSRKLTLYLVVFETIVCFFSNAVGDATSRQTNADGSAIGHAISGRIKPGLQQ